MVPCCSTDLRFNQYVWTRSSQPYTSSADTYPASFSRLASMPSKTSLAKMSSLACRQVPGRTTRQSAQASYSLGPGKNSQDNLALRWPRLGFFSHFLQPIYLPLHSTNTSAPASRLLGYLSMSQNTERIWDSVPYLRKKNAVLAATAAGRLRAAG